MGTLARPILGVLAAGLLPLLAPAEASALPRFAARTGADCMLCHFSPSGGGLRTRYGSHVFQQLELGLEALQEVPPPVPFSGQVTEWLTIGADLRAAYLYSPDRINSFFLMQADLYAGARLGSHLAVVLDLGAYSGFEAWALVRAAAEPSTFNLLLRVGRFTPAFGLRDPNHDLYTRGGIGFGPSDRDTGVELTALAGPFSLSAALVNGTFGDVAFDAPGSEARSFEKALIGRAALRLGRRGFSVQLGGSAYWSDNGDTESPLLGPKLPDAITPERGVDELRLGGFALVGLGRLSYQAEVVYVSDRFAGRPERPAGYASSQELAAVVVQGVEVMATLEFQDPDVEFSGDTTFRAGLAAEIFWWSFLELRLMGRHTIPSSDTGFTDVLVFTHVAF